MSRVEHEATLISVHQLLNRMHDDPKYKEIRYNIRQLRRMGKTVGEFPALSYNCQEKKLEIPDNFLESSYDDQEWMLVHEACHLYQGHDTWLERGVEYLDRLSNRYLDTLHRIFEYNANLQAIRLCGCSLGANGLKAKHFEWMCKVGESEIDAFIQHMDNHLEAEIPLALRGMAGYTAPNQQKGSPNADH